MYIGISSFYIFMGRKGLKGANNVNLKASGCAINSKLKFNSKQGIKQIWTLDLVDYVTNMNKIVHISVSCNY